MPGPLIATDQLGNAYSVVINTLDNNAMVLTPIAPVSPSTADDSITVTALSLITSALRLIGVIASGEAVPIDEANDSLMVLDQMIDAWNADHLAIYTSSSSDYALIAGQQEYTLGPGGDWNSNRPCTDQQCQRDTALQPCKPYRNPYSDVHGGGLADETARQEHSGRLSAPLL
jgi:hypothetical protein